MNKWPVVLVALAAVGLALFLAFNPSSKKPGADDELSVSVEAQPAKPAVVEVASNFAAVPPQVAGWTPPTPEVPVVSAAPPPLAPVPAPAPATPLVDGLPPATVLDNMRNVVRQYGLRFGGNPVGTNPEITKALNGGNPKQVKFIPPDEGLRINEKGELIDSWGTPFFFHQLSAMDMEIRSAGPDKVMWTDDDLVAK